MAVATGDLLFSRAFAELARNEDAAQLRALSEASSALAEGELLQREDAYAAHVAVDRYLRRCELKTAALFEAACRLGALTAAEGSPELAGALGAFARRIGLAFQMLDDVLDVSGPVERTGKARGTDLLDGTVTLPFILARERDAGAGGIDLSSLGGAEQAEELCERIAATGALDEARERALAVVAQAKAELPAILPDGRAELLEPGRRRGGRALSLSARSRSGRSGRRRARATKNSISSDMFAWVIRRRSPSRALEPRSSSSSSRSTAAWSKTPSRRDSHSGQRSTIRQWRGPSSDQSSG